MIGSAVALELARTGKRVIVVDRLPGPGSGSTSASSAIIRYSYTTRDPILTSWEAAQMWFDWEGHLGCVDPDGMARFIECANLIFRTTGYDGTPILPVARAGSGSSSPGCCWPSADHGRPPVASGAAGSSLSWRAWRNR